MGHRQPLNAYFGPLLYITESSKYTLQQVLREIVLEANALQFDMATARPGQPSINLADQVRYAVLIVSMIPMMADLPVCPEVLCKRRYTGSSEGIKCNIM